MKTEPPNYYQGNRSEVAPFLPQNYSRVLEIGCAEGLFSQNLTSNSEKWGCEVFPHAARQASQKMEKVLVGKYSKVSQDIPDNYFDLVICNDVIEHMDDHDAFLESIKTKMKSGAFLVGSIPNLRHIRNLFKLMILKDWRYEEAGVLDKTHLRWFTEKSLRRTLKDHGFSIEKFKGINSTQNIFLKVFLWALIALSLGTQSDIQYLQFAFRVRKP